VIWTQRARDALDEAAAYVAADSPEAGVNLVEGALDAAESLSTLSERGRIVPELNDPTVRETLVYKYRAVRGRSRPDNRTWFHSRGTRFQPLVAR
jgi:plasmid stabilization system protein ParE